MESWRSVELGAYGSGKEYISSIIQQGKHVGRVAKALASKIDLEKSKTIVELVKIASDVDLLNQVDSVAKICESALESSLRLCRPEVALALREQYSEEEEGTIWVGAERLKIGKESGYFSVSYSDRGRWLTFGCGGPSCWWGKWRRRLLTPRQQEKLVPAVVCECMWSKIKSPVYVVFERGY